MALRGTYRVDGTAAVADGALLRTTSVARSCWRASASSGLCGYGSSDTNSIAYSPTWAICTFCPGAGLVLNAAVVGVLAAGWTTMAIRACPVQKHSTCAGQRESSNTSSK